MMKIVSNNLLKLSILVVLSSQDAVEQISPDENWLNYHSFGQLSALSTDSMGNIYVFHRGDRVWDAFSFDTDEKFTKQALGPIKEATIIVLSPSGSLLTTSGFDVFYLPHGITVDYEQNIWTTDVALHQVMKFPPLDLTTKKSPMPLAKLTLGEALVPGHDSSHFCKPTSVAVDSQTGDFFIADGYCNSRIIKYAKNGEKVLQWGKAGGSLFKAKHGPYSLAVPHSLAIDESHQHLFVADRENSRVLCYNMTNGKFMHELNFNNHVYAVTYSSNKDLLLTVTGYDRGVGTIIDVNSWTPTSEFRPAKWFTGAHDVAVSPDGRYTYVVELTENIIWRFTVGGPGNKIKLVDQKRPVAQDKNIKVAATRNESSPSKVIEKNYPNDVNSLPSPSSDISDAISTLTANQVAVSFVTAVILFGFVAVIFHLLRRRGGPSNYEMRGLIHHEDE